jgi:hypothetical protein
MRGRLSWQQANEKAVRTATQLAQRTEAEQKRSRGLTSTIVAPGGCAGELDVHVDTDGETYVSAELKNLSLAQAEAVIRALQSSRLV